MAKKKKIGIVGSRRRNKQPDFCQVYDALMKVYNPGDWLVSGGCSKGADSFAAQIAKDYGLPILTFWPDWRQKGAPFIRNTPIAIHSDILIAQVAPDRKGGTEDTLKKYVKFHPKSSRVILLEEGDKK